MIEIAAFLALPAVGALLMVVTRLETALERDLGVVAGRLPAAVLPAAPPAATAPAAVAPAPAIVVLDGGGPAGHRYDDDVPVYEDDVVPAAVPAAVPALA